MQVTFYIRKRRKSDGSKYVNFCSTGGHFKICNSGLFWTSYQWAREEMQRLAYPHVRLGKRETTEFHFDMIKMHVFALLLDTKERMMHHRAGLFSDANVKHRCQAAQIHRVLWCWLQDGLVLPPAEGPDALLPFPYTCDGKEAKWGGYTGRLNHLAEVGQVTVTL